MGRPVCGEAARLIVPRPAQRANDLVRQGIHPTTIIAGYRLAMREAVKYIKEHLAIKTGTVSPETILQCAGTSLNSKIFGKDSDFFARMAVDAMTAVKTVNEEGKTRYPVKAVGIMKQHGRSVRDSELLQGYALAMGRAAQGMPMTVQPARIALLDIDLRKSKMHMGVQVLVNDPAELEKIRQKELDITAERIKLLIGAGANVILTTKGARAPGGAVPGAGHGGAHAGGTGPGPLRRHRRHGAQVLCQRRRHRRAALQARGPAAHRQADGGHRAHDACQHGRGRGGGRHHAGAGGQRH